MGLLMYSKRPSVSEILRVLQHVICVRAKHY